ncbi:MAG: L,D-transpeptidase [Gloeobacteraceae cyanobacterium ES-bin-144]|nr:L,D-transpeptidase [Verrucomicrobiales bacterium]
MDDQKLRVFQDDQCVREFDVSTSEKGMGFLIDSYRTPTGRFRICEKTGEGEPILTIFKQRRPVGMWLPGDDMGSDLILTRILRIEGLDAENANTFERCIYIHGTNREDLLGERAGHGCVRLGNREMIELFDLLEGGELVEILPATQPRGKLLFLSFDRWLDEDPTNVERISNVRDILNEARRQGWQLVLMTRFESSEVQSIVRNLGIEYIETLAHEGNSALHEMIREWISAIVPERMALIGDSELDWQIRPDLDQLIVIGEKKQPIFGFEP